jgi:MFS family permease
MADGACLYQWEYGVLIGFGFTLVFGAGSLFAGWVCDRRSRVVVASASLMVWSVATALQASAHSFLYLLVFRAIIGLAQAFAMPAAISILSDYFVEKQGVAVKFLSVGLYLGSGCASFSLLFAMALGWRWSVLLAGLVGISLTPVLYHTVKEPERTIFNAPCNLQVVVDEVFEKSRVARMLTVAASCKMVATYSLSAFLPIWYSRRGLTGYSAYSYACWNALVISSGGVLSALMGDVLGTRWAPRDNRAPCWIGLIGSVVAIPLVCVMLLASHFGVSMFAFFLFLFASESWFGPTVSLYQASVRRSVRGQAVSLFLIASSLAGNLGPALVGFFDPGGERIGLHLLWICITANLGAAFAFVWTAREISVDPVAAGFHDQKEDNLQESLGTKAGTAHWATF